MRRLGAVGFIAAGTMWMCPVPLAHAGGTNSITVTTLADESEADAVNGECSLREAISAANKNAQVDSCQAGHATETDTITLISGESYLLTKPGADDTNAGGDLDIFDDDPAANMGLLAINVPLRASVVQQVALERVFHIDPPGSVPATTVQIFRLNISGGNGSPSVGVSGAGIFNDGPNISLSLLFVEITGNSGGMASSGGGIRSDGPLNIQNSEIHTNSAGNFGGGVFAGANTTILKSTFADNSTAADGGGIYSSGATMTLDNSTISGNSAGRHGGGIYVVGGTMQIRDSTITNNTADTDAPNAGEGGGLNRNLGTVDLQGTILAGNHDNTGGGPDCFGTSSVGPTSSGHNLIGDDTGCFYTPGTGDIVNPVDPLSLGSLEDNQPAPIFVTRTHRPLPDSPAIDAAETTNCAANNHDQRELTRPSGPACDIGAVESQIPSGTSDVTAPTSPFQLKRKFKVQWQVGNDDVGVEGYQVRPRASKVNAMTFTFQNPILLGGGDTSTNFNGKPGSTYCFDVQFRNGDERLSEFGDERCTALPIDDTSLSKLKPSDWNDKKNKRGYYLNSFSQSDHEGAKLQVNVKQVRQVALVATKCPDCGKVEVRLGSDVLKTVNLNAGAVQKKRLINIPVPNAPRNGKVTIEVVSNNKLVKIEGLGVSKVT